MPHSQARSLQYLPLLAAFWLASLGALSATAAEEELTLLTIEGDLISRIETLNGVSDSALIIRSYYNLLPTEIQSDLESFRSRLSALLPGYEVSFNAADSAELTEVMDDINVIWAAIQSIHGQNFTREVKEILNTAYGDVYSFLSLDNANQSE